MYLVWVLLLITRYHLILFSCQGKIDTSIGWTVLKSPHSTPRIMATAIQKNGMKPLPNGNGLVHHEVQELTTLTGYSEVETCTEVTQQELQQHTDNEPEIDIVINNVVCCFSVRCHLNLREIALNGMNVEYRKENGMVTMKLRRPYTTASIWSSGKVTCTGATSEVHAKIAARRFARCLQKLGFNARFNNYKVVNVLGTCSMPFAIRINSFSERHKEAEWVLTNQNEKPLWSFLFCFDFQLRAGIASCSHL